MSDIHLKLPGFSIVHKDCLLKTKKESKILKKQKIQNIFT